MAFFFLVVVVIRIQILIIIIITLTLTPNSTSNSVSATSASASESCPSSSCQSSEPVIRFPFRLESLQDSSCGYPHPAFTLSCNPFNQTFISLPNSGPDFAVHAVDYARQNIWLNDPAGCLPNRLLHLNLSGSPFTAAFFQDFTLFRCRPGIRFTDFNSIDCLSDGNHTVFATSSDRVAPLLASRCVPMATVAVPVKWDFFEPDVTSDLSEDIRLAWGTPRCGRCESRGGQCTAAGGNSTAVECSNIAGRRLPRHARYAIIVGAGIPAFLCLSGLIYYVASRMKRCCCPRWRHRRPGMEYSMAVAPHPPITIRSGLDGPTIESYPTTTLGESRRLPNPDDNICSICLSEYVAKDTLRSIPQCEHTFHTECIDKWLRQNPSCPVCRNSPKPSPTIA